MGGSVAVHPGTSCLGNRTSQKKKTAFLGDLVKIQHGVENQGRTWLLTVNMTVVITIRWDVGHYNTITMLKHAITRYNAMGV